MGASSAISKLCKRAAAGLPAAIEAACSDLAGSTPLVQAHFLAQCAHESVGFSRLVENMNYSAARLREIWPLRFTPQSANDYAFHPEAIANHVYADRLGNGDEASGDGWRYRGRGIIQLTGKANYQAASLALFGDDRLVQNPALAAEPSTAARAAVWFWNIRKLSLHAAADNVEAVTRGINGGRVGLRERKELLHKFKIALAA